MHPVSTLAAQLIAASIVVLTAPLLFELGVCVLGNLRRTRMPGKTRVQDVRLAVIVPAENREEIIAQTIQSLFTAGCSLYLARHADRSASNAWEIPVFVVAYNCADSTAAVAAGSGARVVAVHDEPERGRNLALRLGFEAAQGSGANAFLVVDADTTPSPNLIAATRAALADGAAATQCRLELEPRASEPAHSLSRLRAMIFRGSNVVRGRGRAGLDFSAGLLGDGFALTAKTLERAPYNEREIAGPFEYHAQLTAAGVSVRWVDHAAVYVAEHSDEREEQPVGLREAIKHAQAKWKSVSRLLTAAARGNWRAIEPLAEALSIPVWLGAPLLLAGARLPLPWMQTMAAASALLLAGYAAETLLLGGELRQDLMALGIVPAHRLRTLTTRTRAPRTFQQDAAMSGSQREVRLP